MTPSLSDLVPPEIKRSRIGRIEPQLHAKPVIIPEYTSFNSHNISTTEGTDVLAAAADPFRPVMFQNHRQLIVLNILLPTMASFALFTLFWELTNTLQTVAYVSSSALAFSSAVATCLHLDSVAGYKHVDTLVLVSASCLLGAVLVLWWVFTRLSLLMSVVAMVVASASARHHSRRTASSTDRRIDVELAVV
jgi:hypothetical protein